MTGQRLRAYRFALDPTADQLGDLQQHADAARWAYNHALAAKLAAHRTWRLQVDELVTLGWSEADARRQATVRVPTKPTIQKQWNRLKGDETRGVHGICPWWRKASTYAFQSAFLDADRAWQNWLDSLTGRRTGRRVQMPVFKRKGKTKASFRLHHNVKQPAIRLETNRRLRMPRLGSIRLHESGKRMARALARGGAVQSVTVSRGGHRWYAAVLVSEPDITPGRETQGGSTAGPPGPSKAQQQTGKVGIDLGVNRLATLSTGETIDNPRHLQRARKRLLKAQRRLDCTQKRSKRRTKAVARLAKLHHEIAEARTAHLHQITKRLTTGWDTIALEDLNVSGMTRSARGTIDTPGRNVRAKSGLNRAILDVAPFEFRRQVDYKTSWYGSTIALCDRWFASSSTCSDCTVKTKLSLSERVFRCGNCGLVLDRDENAARNIAAATSVAPDRGETQNARGDRIRPPAPKGQAAVVNEAGRPGHSTRPPRGSNPPIALTTTP